MEATISLDKKLDLLAEHVDKVTLAIDRLTGDAEQRKLEIDRILAEMSEKMATSHKELAEAHKRTEEIVGNLGGRFGVLVELLVIPGVCPALNEFGHEFTRVSPNMYLQSGKKRHSQVDLMLYNSTEAMAVEIKSKLDRNDVMHHIERLKKLREFEKSFFLEGLTLLGAVAAIVFDDKARELALDNGLYVIEIREDEDRVVAEQPEAGKIGKW